VYDGRHGESLKLIGLEPGINDRAEERRIVMHGAAYVNPYVVQRLGQLGRSWGCPAVDHAVLAPIVRQVKDGTALFAYYPDPRCYASRTTCSAARSSRRGKRHRRRLPFRAL
jgi:hypothetical protein